MTTLTSSATSTNQQNARTDAPTAVPTDAWWRWRQGADEADTYAALLGPHAVARQPRPRASRR